MLEHDTPQCHLSHKLEQVREYACLMEGSHHRQIRTLLPTLWSANQKVTIFQFQLFRFVPYPFGFMRRKSIVFVSRNISALYRIGADSDLVGSYPVGPLVISTLPNIPQIVNSPTEGEELNQQLNDRLDWSQICDNSTSRLLRRFPTFHNSSYFSYIFPDLSSLAITFLPCT